MNDRDDINRVLAELEDEQEVDSERLQRCKEMMEGNTPGLRAMPVVLGGESLMRFDVSDPRGFDEIKRVSPGLYNGISGNRPDIMERESVTIYSDGSTFFTFDDMVNGGIPSTPLAC